MNKFYQIHPAIQWLVALVLFLAGITIMVFWINLSNDSPASHLLIFVFVPIWQFLFTPFFKLIGLYRYLSPMVLVFSPTNKKYDLHNGTSFDYLFSMQGIKPGIEWRKLMLVYYLDALLEIVDSIEKGNLPDTVEVRGSSYFFSERTARKLGFEIDKTGVFEKINLLINYVDLLWMYSLASGSLRWPDLRNIKTAKTTGRKLLQQKSGLLALKAMYEVNLNTRNV